MVFYCSVPGCPQKYIHSKDTTFSFHSFPKRESLRKQWLDAIGIDGKKLKKHSKVCSKHFLRSDFRLAKGTRKLKHNKDIVPSVFNTEEHLIPHSYSWDNNLEVGRMCDVITYSELSHTGNNIIESGQLCDFGISDQIDSMEFVDIKCDSGIHPISNHLEEHSYSKSPTDLEILELKKYITYLESKLKLLEQTNQEHSKFSSNIKNNYNNLLLHRFIIVQNN